MWGAWAEVDARPPSWLISRGLRGRTRWRWTTPKRSRRGAGEEDGEGRAVHSVCWSIGPLPRLLQSLPLQNSPQRLMGERRHTANVIDIGFAVIDGFLVPPDQIGGSITQNLARTPCKA